jgi:predicted transcriptional regulator
VSWSTLGLDRIGPGAEGGKVLAQQRHAYVLERLSAEGAVRVTDVVAGLGVSDGTVRRDLELLEQQGLLTRVRGGAVSVASAASPALSTVPTALAPGGGAVIGMLVPSTTYYYPEVIRGAQEAVTH